MLFANSSAQDNGTIITQWTFDDTLQPSIGVGSASLIGGTETHSTTLNNGWRITSFPDQSEASGTAGAEFLVSTAGFENISISFGHRSSGTMSRWAEIQYTTDGGSNWNTFANNEGELSPHDTVYDFSFDLSGVDNVSNNPLFGFRIVSIFSPVDFNPEVPDEIFPANTAYHRARTEGTGGNEYSGDGNWRLLNVTVSSGEVDPDPVLPDAFALWTFDNTTEPVLGTGTASLLGGTEQHSATLDNGWRITSFPEQFEASGSAGAEFMVSTAGFENISISYGHRSSGTMSRWAQIQYTVDGGSSWEVLTDNGGALSPHDNVYDFEYDLSSISEVNNNPNFGIRIVSIFSPVAFNPEEPNVTYEPNTAYHRAREEGTGGNPYSGDGNWRLLNVGFFGEAFTSTEPIADVPARIKLEQNYPNPFNPTTSIRYTLNESGSVNLSVYNLMGQRVAVLQNGAVSQGSHTVTFDAANLASGMYIYRLEAAGQVLTRKMMLVK
ncbi:MAG: T9SS type A sorting domain-containing protein [Balneolales bacterium]|nr:T9SS type A sorting domain-containing protein [Balneolales bacterium]